MVGCILLHSRVGSTFNTDKSGDFDEILAAKANLLTGGRRPAVLDALGMACAEMGKFGEAQLAARQALNLAGAQKPAELAARQQRLELYQNHQPWRESFRATNAPPRN